VNLAKLLLAIVVCSVRFEPAAPKLDVGGVDMQFGLAGRCVEFPVVRGFAEQSIAT
jgi:hypothetical protein